LPIAAEALALKKHRTNGHRTRGKTDDICVAGMAANPINRIRLKKRDKNTGIQANTGQRIQAIKPGYS
jgi:hypothetical protein